MIAQRSAPLFISPFLPKSINPAATTIVINAAAKLTHGYVSVPSVPKHPGIAISARCVPIISINVPKTRGDVRTFVNFPITPILPIGIDKTATIIPAISIEP